MNMPFYCCRFYVTHACVSHCSFCDTHDPVYQSFPVMPLGEAKALIHQMAECGCKYIDFTGGEPMLNPHLPELIQYAKSLGIKTEVTTSGAQGITETTRQCAALSDKFNVSLDTLSPSAYAKIRGVLRLEQTLKVIRETVQIRRVAGLASVKIMTVVTQTNASELPLLLQFAEKEGVELYLNPMFSYFVGQDDAEDDAESFVSLLERYTFRRNAVIMLHFMEFYRCASEADSRPLCSANRQTLTFAANGSLLLPCYHARQRHSVPIHGNLKEYLLSEEFQRFCHTSLPQCGDCTVTPYFGISFSFRLDKYFLLASFSEKLIHMKRDYLNAFDLNIPETALLEKLEELKRIVNSLNPGPRPDNDALYWAEKSGEEYAAPVYRYPVSQAQYEKDRLAPDCWALEKVPHRLFDRLSGTCFPSIVAWLSTEPDNTELRDILSQAQECMLRWWSYYISKWFKVSVCCDMEDNARWLEQYLSKIRRCFSDHGCTEPFLPEMK